jgi:hypothetical protein
MTKQFLRAHLRAKPEGADSANAQALEFVASTEGIKRDGMSLRAEDWYLDNFRKNPVFLWAHDYMGRNLPLGRVELKFEGTDMIAAVTFDEADPFAREVKRKYQDGYLHAVSVGWDIIDRRTGQRARKDTPEIQFMYDLLDVSGVPVPGDPDALKRMGAAGLRSILGELGVDQLPLQGDNPFLDPEFVKQLVEGREPEEPKIRAVPPHKAELADPSTTLRVLELSALEPEAKRAAHAWSDNTRYLFPHHNPDGTTVWRGVAASMAQLYLNDFGLSESDRRLVYTHLSRHYTQFGKEPPEYLDGSFVEALTPVEVRGLFLSGEAELLPHLFRAGASLSRRNRDDVQKAADLLNGLLERTAKETEAEREEAEEEQAVEGLQRLKELLVLPASK